MVGICLTVPTERRSLPSVTLTKITCGRYGRFFYFEKDHRTGTPLWRRASADLMVVVTDGNAADECDQIL